MMKSFGKDQLRKKIKDKYCQYDKKKGSEQHKIKYITFLIEIPIFKKEKINEKQLPYSCRLTGPLYCPFTLGIFSLQTNMDLTINLVKERPQLLASFNDFLSFYKLYVDPSIETHETPKRYYDQY